MMHRTNERWIADLSAAGEVQERALADLRSRLLLGLRAAMAGKELDGALLEDAVQEALVRLLAKLHTFRHQSRFETWAMTIAVRAVWTLLRRRHWQHVSLDSLLEAAGPAAAAPLASRESALRGAERSRLVEGLHRAIQSDLTERQRKALLAELAGMPQVEIARHLGSNRNALYKLVHDARKRLKRSLETAGFSTADIASAFE